MKAFLLRRSVKKLNQKTALEISLDDLLSDEMKRMTMTGRTAEKVLKLKVMRQENRKALDSIHDLDDDLEDPEEAPDVQDQIVSGLINKFLGSGSTTPQADAGGSEDFGDPLAQAIPQPSNPLLDAVGAMTPAQMKELKGKFLG